MDPFEKHGETLSSFDGRFIAIGDGPKQEPQVRGLLLDIEDSTKYPGNKVYTIGTKDEILKVGGNTYLNDKITEIGALYDITFTGTARGKRGTNFKTFEVRTVRAEVVEREGYGKFFKSDPDVEPAKVTDDLPF